MQFGHFGRRRLQADGLVTAAPGVGRPDKQVHPVVWVEAAGKGERDVDVVVYFCSTTGDWASLLSFSPDGKGGPLPGLVLHESARLAVPHLQVELLPQTAPEPGLADHGQVSGGVVLHVATRGSLGDAYEEKKRLLSNST